MYILAASGKSNRFESKFECRMFSLISGRHVGVQTGYKHGVSIRNSIHIPEMFRQITQERNIAQI